MDLVIHTRQGHNRETIDSRYSHWSSSGSSRRRAGGSLDQSVRRTRSLAFRRVSALLALALTSVLLAPASSLAQAESPPWVYTIREGDTLIAICRAYLR